MSNEDKYFICKKIDEPVRLFGLTLDEFIPILITLGICTIFGSLITGFIFAGIVWFVIRNFKKGQGTSWFLNMLYWYLPLEFLRGVLFVKTPPSSARHWLS
jgi:conjugal transfer pilus assembly protein TraL